MYSRATMGGIQYYIIMVNNSRSSKNGNKRNTKSKMLVVSHPRTVQSARGSRKRIAKSSGKMQAILRHGLNAFHPLHIPLPISTGKYSVIRVSSVITSDSYLTLVGAMDFSHHAIAPYSDSVWTNYAGISRNNGTDSLSGTWSALSLPSPTGSDSRGYAEVVPAAVSVQVLNPASLTAASGVVYMGRCATTLSGVDQADTRTVSDFCDALISYSHPKVISGAKLAMSPQQVNCIPSNINELTDFKELGPPSDQANPSTSFTWDDHYGFSGFKPAYIINPQKQTLMYRVCMEFRVRLSPFNPMHMQQQLHKPTSHDMWHKLVGQAESVGHGVEDVGVAGAAGYMMTGAGEGFMAEAGSYIASAASAALPALEAVAPALLL